MCDVNFRLDSLKVLTGQAFNQSQLAQDRLHINLHHFYRSPMREMPHGSLLPANKKQFVLCRPAKEGSILHRTPGDPAGWERGVSVHEGGAEGH